MIRLNKMTDYAVVMLSHLAVDSDRVVTAKELARGSALPLPSVSKLMKQLSKAGILTSHRGASGGYRLGRAPTDISVAEIVTIFEGPIALTGCIEGADTSCDAMPQCSLSGHWNQVNHAIQVALDSVSLADLLNTTYTPAPKELISKIKSRDHATDNKLVSMIGRSS